MNEEKRPLPRMRTIKQIAELGVIGEWTLRRLVAEQRVPCVRVGNRVLINVDLLIDLLNAGEF